jgi:LEA14-like dessication related protein
MNKKIMNCLILLCFFGISCTSFKPPVTTFSKYEISGIGFTSAEVTFFFDVDNPNDIPISIKDIHYSVFLDDANILNGTDEGFSISPQETKLVKFPIKVEYSKLIGPAMGVAQKFLFRSGSVQYHITGDLDVFDNIGYSVNAPIDAKGELILQ